MNARQYRKKPLPVSAFLWDGAVCYDHLPAGTIHSVYTALDGAAVGCIETSEGRVSIRQGTHYIVGPGHGGEFWPVEKSIFEATYESI